MQIHEITRRKTNEGVLSGIAGAAKAVGSQIAAQANDWATKKTGTDFSQLGPKNPYGDQQKAAAAAAVPVIKAQAEQQQQLWNTAIAKTQEQSNVQSPAQLDTGTKQGLAKSLMNQIHKNFLQGKVGTDYQQLPKWVDGKAQQQATDIVNRITDAKQSILNFNNPNKTAQQAMAEWQTLSQATYDAMSLMQFNSASGTSGAKKNPNTPGGPAAPAPSPAVSQATQQIQQTGITQPQLQQIQNIVGKLPNVTSQDSQTKAYLQALGFNTP
jgi:hypothetical protein